ncbi:BadF/BadG/BcrA/BcrD ATPase family protein [Microbacterium hydrocarbonoxydans]|uniref:BadF/BadG/BcrA/BcrD ATPase family protein n=1 Tax=Microbacterium hydrocarbonoxydans TaxID=273678 RepID=UPI003D966713
MSTLALLSMDAGQTGTKVRLRWADGSSRDDLLPGVLTDRPLAPQLADIAERVSHVAGAVPSTLAIGVTGVTDVRAEADALLDRPALAEVRRVIVAHDSITSFLGVLGDQQGAVVAVGTGVVTLGVGPRSAVRVDGWGNIMGDAGSGYWIGREALDAVMRAYDGRGEQTALTPLVRERWPDLEGAYTSLQADPDRVRLVASFAAPTAALAADGDPVARRICEAAAAELALSVTSALQRTSAAADAPVGAIGGVLRSDLIRSAFETSVRAARTAVRFIPPVGTGLDGVDALVELAADHPLRGRLAELVRAEKEVTA